MKLQPQQIHLKPGESGTAEFIAGEEGTYYYICTVPGHRDQGMVGEIIVSGSSGLQQLQQPQLVYLMNLNLIL